MRDPLSRAIVDHHVHRQRVADRLQALGHSAAAEFLREGLPRDDRTRKGNFGEVVASEHLIQRYGYTMPVFKLRYRDSNLPMRGEDIVAFKIDHQQRISCVIIGEAKTVVRYSADTVRHARERLKTAYHPRPMTLGMLAEILYGMDNQTLASQIDDIAIRLAKDAFPRENWIFLICQDCPADPLACLNGNGNTLPDLRCANLSLSDLTGFVYQLFDHSVLE
ncbi:MAG: Hachiman antiphage defense system protein HamA [Gammaproteobacteria bacterium]